MYVCECVCEHTHAICSRHAHQQWKSQGELRSAGADVPEEGADIDWNGSRGEIAGWLYPRFTQLISKAHSFHILRDIFTVPKNIAAPPKDGLTPGLMLWITLMQHMQEKLGEEKKSWYFSFKRFEMNTWFIKFEMLHGQKGNSVIFFFFCLFENHYFHLLHFCTGDNMQLIWF